MTEFSLEDWGAVREQVVRNWPEHYEEAYGDGDYAPDFEKYDALGALGMLMVVVARRAGELVGYVVVLIQNHLHQKDVLWGCFDSYWLRKDCRAPRMILRLIEAAERLLEGRGVSKLYATERTDGRLFAHLGWRAAERVYVKRIERWE